MATEDNRSQDIIDHLKGSFTAAERKSLVSDILGWNPPNDEHGQDTSIMEILSDMVLGKESSFKIMLEKDLEELPLYLINGAKNDRCIAKWRLRCGK